MNETQYFTLDQVPREYEVDSHKYRFILYTKDGGFWRGIGLGLTDDRDEAYIYTWNEVVSNFPNNHKCWIYAVDRDVIKERQFIISSRLRQAGEALRINTLAQPI